MTLLNRNGNCITFDIDILAISMLCVVNASPYNHILLISTYIKLHRDKKHVRLLCLYCDFLTVSGAMTNNWDVATINNNENIRTIVKLGFRSASGHLWASRPAKTWASDQFGLIDVLSSEQFLQTTLCLLWLMSFSGCLPSHSLLWWSRYWLYFNRVLPA